MAFVAATVLATGCANKNVLHPALQIGGQELDRAIARGQNMMAQGVDPQDALSYRMVDVNQRVSGEVILRSAGICMPADLIAYDIAKSGDASDSGVRRATAQALKETESQLVCVAKVQLPASADPATALTFSLRTSMGQQYPPLAVETPQLLGSFESPYDPSAAPASLYYYVIRFPVRGGPGVPPIGPQVSSLTLGVSDGTAEATYTFQLPKVETAQ